MCEDIYDDLWEVQWIQIPDVPYITKYKFEEDGYTIMISDLSVIYGEKLAENEVQERFCIVNPYAEMKSKVIVKHVKQSLEESLVNNDSKVKLQCTPQTITIRLQFSVSQVFFIFDIKPHVLPCEKLRTHLIAPTVLTALSIHQENLTLKQKIKDLEKREGSTLSTQKPKDHKRKLVNSVINKRSKILVTDVLESFLHMQKTIEICISDSKALKDDASTHSEQTSSSLLHLSASKSSPLKGTVKDEFGVAASLKYEDVEDSSASAQVKEASAFNVSVFPLKREMEDLSKIESNSSIQPQQLHTKLKKKMKF